MRSVLQASILSLLMLPAAGCAATSAGPGVPVARPSVTVVGSLGAARRLQLAVPPVAADIRTFKIHLRRDAGAERLLGELPGTARTLAIADLAPNTPYEVRIEAFDADGGRIDADDERCVTAFETGSAERLDGVTFKLKLKDVEGAQ